MKSNSLFLVARESTGVTLDEGRGDAGLRVAVDCEDRIGSGKEARSGSATAGRGGKGEGGVFRKYKGSSSCSSNSLSNELRLFERCFASWANWSK